MARSDLLLLSVDVGTSAVKALLVQADGTVEARSEELCPPDSPRPGWLEVPPERWWQATRKVVARLLTGEEEGRFVAPERVQAAGLSAAFPTLLLFDEQRQPLRPAILYADQRSAPQAHWLAHRLGADRFAQLTGNRLAPGNCTLTSLRWVMEEEPRLFGRASSFGYANSYLALKLTGHLALDQASAPLTGLYDLRAGRWSDELLSAAGVPPGLLPPLLAPSSVVGELTARAARELGLPAGMPVAIGSGDTVTSALGAGAYAEEPFLTCGSTDSLVNVTSEPQPLAGFVTTGAALPGHWLRIGARSATGAAVSWAAREVLCVDLKRFFTIAAEAPPGANGVFFLPHLAGERTPLWDPEARGVFTGLTLAATAADVARAVLEGVAFGVREMLELSSQGARTDPQRVRAAGGATRDPFWRQLRADVSGVDFLYLSMEETAAFGAALLAGAAAGLVTDALAVARNAQQRTGADLVTPEPNRARLYNSLARQYARLYPTLRPLLRSSAPGGNR